MRISSIRYIIFAALIAIFLPFSSAQQSSQPLTNSAVVEMVKAGLGDSVVLAAIHAQANQFQLFAKDLIALKQAGVSDAIIAAMLSPGVASQAFPKTPAKTINSITEVRSIFVDGNNEAASNARNDFLKIASKYPKTACFTPVGVRKSADAILQIAESDTAGGSGGLFGGTNLESTVASGTLTNAEGDLLWSNSKQGSQGMFHTGAGDAARMLILPLYLAAGCSSGGLRLVAGKLGTAPLQPEKLAYIRKLYLTGSKQRAINSGTKDLATYTCMEAVSDPKVADAIVVLEQSSDEIPRGAFKSLYTSATLESNISKAALWSYDEGDVYLPGNKNGVHTWWEQLNQAVGCGKTRKGKGGVWPAASPKE